MEDTVRHDEEFEPALRSMLKKFADLPSHPKVYLWAFPEMAVPLNDSIQRSTAIRSPNNGLMSLPLKARFALGCTGDTKPGLD